MKNSQIEADAQSRVCVLQTRVEDGEKREKRIQTRLHSQSQILKDNEIQIKFLQNKIHEAKETLSRFQKTAQVRFRVQLRPNILGYAFVIRDNFIQSFEF